VRVLIDTTFALRGPSGTGVYLERIAAALAGVGVEVLEAAHDGRRRPGSGGARSVLNALSDRWWTDVELPRRAAEVEADVLHHPLPALARRAPCPQVVTVHDLAFERLPECFDPAFRTYARLSHRAAARGADAVVAVSKTTALDVMARWGVPAERVVVAPHGPGQEPAALSPREQPRHFLYVGDDEPRKNLPALLEAHHLYRSRAGDQALPLVLAGTARCGDPGVRVEDRPEPERLARLYAEAAALVHPSLHEGFGLTALEAMTAGTPVVAARSPGVVEVCADAVLYADPRNPCQLAGQLARVATDATLRRDLTERGRRRAAEFSWARCAREHLRAYTLAVR
jgi:glycosyltransferase involved in cell wall biosynthesis